MGAMNALTDVSKAMSALVENLSRHPARNSRGRDGDVVIHKDISRVFEKVPEDILERVQYVKTVENRLQTNTSGVLLKIDSEIISSIRVADDATVASNFRMYEFKNVQLTVPFAVVFSDAGKSSQVMLSNSDGEDCYVTIPTRIMTPHFGALGRSNGALLASTTTHMPLEGSYQGYAVPPART